MRISRHALHGNSGNAGRHRRTRRMVAQRKSRAGSRSGRSHRRRTRHRHHETRGAECGRRSAVHPHLHGRERRTGHRLGGRSGHGIQPERAGQPELREVCPAAHAGTFGQPGVLRSGHPRLRDFRTVQDAGPLPHDDEGMPLARSGDAVPQDGRAPDRTLRP